MRITFTKIGTVATLKLYERFDFPTHSIFNKAVASALQDAHVTDLIIDLREVTYLDSSALGMLLIARGKARNVTVSLCCTNNEAVTQVLGIVNFHKLFKIT